MLGSLSLDFQKGNAPKISYANTLDYSEWRNLKICTMTASEKASFGSPNSVFLPCHGTNPLREIDMLFLSRLPYFYGYLVLSAHPVPYYSLAELVLLVLAKLGPLMLVIGALIGFVFWLKVRKMGQYILKALVSNQILHHIT